MDYLGLCLSILTCIQLEFSSAQPTVNYPYTVWPFWIFSLSKFTFHVYSQAPTTTAPSIYDVMDGSYFRKGMQGFEKENLLLYSVLNVYYKEILS